MLVAPHFLLPVTTDVRRNEILSFEINNALEKDVSDVSAVLTEAAKWLDFIDQSLWQVDELTTDFIENDVRFGLYFIAWLNQEAVGVFKLQLEDRLIWPDVPQGDSVFIHRMAIKRNVAGKGIADKMINWAKSYAKEIGMAFLRLDCEIRPRLCALYERNGFIKHSERHIGAHLVARYEINVGNYEPIA